jgi:hypothetical protein
MLLVLGGITKQHKGSKKDSAKASILRYFTLFFLIVKSVK